MAQAMMITRFSLLIVFILAGCDGLPFRQPSESNFDSTSTAVPVSKKSMRIAAYYASLQARLLSQGKLRQDRNPPDAPYTLDNLVRNFEKVALYDEYTAQRGVFVEKQTSSYLRRWQTPVRVGVYFGASVSLEQRSRDRKLVRSFAKRLSATTRLKIRVTDISSANFVILFLNRDEQSSDPAKLAANRPDLLLPPIVRDLRISPRNIFCVAYAFSDAKDSPEYTGAVILIKSEHSSIMRHACIEEEMTQALGLANDGPDIRPSIFNDDDEFALLTHHDEILLKMLYDPRLKVGMTAQSARPLLRKVAQDALKRSRY